MDRPPNALRLKTHDGLIIAAPPTLSAITTYVLLEQEAWFEKEIAFLRRYLEPGMNVVDIGANLGVYSVPMVRLVGPTGRAFAYEPGTEARNLLEQSRGINNLDNLEIVANALSNTERQGHLAQAASSELRVLGEANGGEPVHITSLDREHVARQWPSIDLIKIDAEGEEERIVEGGRTFFAAHSPLVIFEVKAGDTSSQQLRRMFPALGFQVFRQMVGAAVLVPDEPSQPLDHYELNLFAAKPDRVSALRQRGLLIDALPGWQPDDSDRHAALAFWRRQTCNLAGSSFAADGMLSSDTDYQQALIAYAVWADAARPLATRCAALSFALQKLRAVCARALTPERASTLARAAWEWGARTLSNMALERLLRLLHTPTIALKEPFAFPRSGFDERPDGSSLVEWLTLAAAEQFERSFGFSSLFVGASPMLGWICSRKLASVEMERRRILVAARNGEKPRVPARLTIAAPDHLNADIWAAGLVPGTVL